MSTHRQTFWYAFRLMTCAAVLLLPGMKAGALVSSGPVYSTHKIFAPGMTISQVNANSSPTGEDVTKVIDGNTSTKYLNFNKLNTGFIVNTGTSSIARSISITTANDFPERDPVSYTLEGSNDGSTWSSITSGSLTCSTTRFATQSFGFINTAAYSYYRVVFPSVCNTATATVMQVSEVQLYQANEVYNTTSGYYYSTIQDGVDAAASGNTLIVAAGTYTENITVNKGVTLQGPNVGVAGTGTRVTEAKLLNCNIDVTSASAVTIDGFDIYQTDNNPDVVLINAGTPATIQNNKIEGFGSVAGQPARAITTSAGSGVKVIQNNLFTGDASGGVFSGHKGWNSGVYVNGASSTVSLLNNTFENCRTALNLDDFNNGITVSGNTFYNSGTAIGFGGSASTSGQYVLGANNFNNTVDAVINLSNVTTAFRLDITSSSFNGVAFSSLPLASLFQAEAGMYHRGRSGKNGLVTYVAGKQYVYAGLTTIQSAIDYGTSGDVITAKAGATTYNERLTVTKPLTIQGEDKATTLLDGTGLAGTGSGIFINNGMTHVTIKDLTIQNFSGTNGNVNAGIYANSGNDYLTVSNTIIKNNVGGSGIYANGPLTNVTIDGNTISGHTVSARGIVIWNGLKSNITITGNEVFNNNCCGIELQDGSATGVTMTGNNVHDNADNGIGIVGLQGPGSNTISLNNLSNNGRFGIEIKNPNGSGAASGAGSIVINGNSVSRSTPIADARDIAGIAVFRRGVLTGNVDVPYGTVVSNNTVSGYIQASSSDGFGIVMEGINHMVLSNTVSGNDVGIQRQAGHLPYPGDGDQSNVADDYFGRGNSPVTCGVVLTGNVFSGNTIDTRDVGSSGGAGIVTNVNSSKSYCSIQAAVDDASPNNVISASAGTYNESVLVNKSVTINGAQAGVLAKGRSGLESILDPNSATSHGFNVVTDNVTIDGFTITNAAAYPSVSSERYGVVTINKISSGNFSGINVKNNVISRQYKAIDFNYTNNFEISGNWLHGESNAYNYGCMWVDDYGTSCSNGLITNNDLDGYASVVEIQGDLTHPVSNTTISLNRSTGGQYVLFGLQNSTVYRNLVSNVTTGSHVYIGGGCNNTTITENFFDNGSSNGIRIENFSGAGINSNLSIFKNSITGHNNAGKYEISVDNPGYSGSLAATCNWFGSTVPATVAAKISGNVTYIPYLNDGTDGNAASGFQPAAICSGSCGTLTLSSAVTPLYPMAGQKIQTIFLNYPSSAQTETINTTVNGGGTAPFVYNWTVSGYSTTFFTDPGTSSYTFAPTAANVPSGSNADNLYTFNVSAHDAQGCTIAPTSKRINVVNPYTTVNGVTKIVVCHKVYNRNVYTTQLLYLDSAQVPAHLAHGDPLGNCAAFTGRETAPSVITSAVNEEEQTIVAYPNPTTGAFTLELSAIHERADITVMDMQGKVLMMRSLGVNDGLKTVFNLNGYSAGMYFIQVKDGETSYRSRIVLR